MQSFVFTGYFQGSTEKAVTSGTTSRGCWQKSRGSIEEAADCGFRCLGQDVYFHNGWGRKQYKGRWSDKSMAVIKRLCSVLIYFSKKKGTHSHWVTDISVLPQWKGNWLFLRQCWILNFKTSTKIDREQNRCDRQWVLLIHPAVLQKVVKTISSSISMLVALSCFVLNRGNLAARWSSVLCEIKHHFHNKNYQPLTYKSVLPPLDSWEHSR